MRVVIDSLEDQFRAAFGEVIKGSVEYGELFFVCPKCGQKSLACNVQKGLYFCHVCSYGKGCSPFTGLPTEVVSRPANLSLQLSILKKTLDLIGLESHHRKYLAQRGITNPNKYKIKTIPFGLSRVLLTYFTRSELVESGLFYDNLDPSLTLQPDRIMIPYWHFGEIVSFKTREDPAQLNEYEPKYAIPRGGKNSSYLFCVDNILEGDVILTEGELKVIVANEFGFKACSVPGVAARAEALDQLSKVLDKVRRVYVVFDTDVSFNKGVLISALDAVKTIGDKAALVFLPNYGLGKMDLDRFLLVAGREHLEEILDNGWETKERTFRACRRRVGN